MDAGERADGRDGRRDRAIAIALFAGTAIWMLAVEGRQGIGRDEGQYMRAAERYWGWFENLPREGLRVSLSDAGIDRYWSDNPEHPPVMKTLYGLSWRLFHRCDCRQEAGLHPIPVRGRHVTLPLFARESTAFRFPAILFAAWLATLVFRFARGLVGRAGAAAAAVLAIAQPHYFFHAQIACFDAPITTLAFAVGVAYWKSLRSPCWGILCGVLFGIALGTKHNAWLIPLFLAAHYLWIRRGDLRRRRLPRVPLAFVSMATVGPLLFVLLWPRMWHHPWDRTRWYFARHLQHEHYNFEYLGRNFNIPERNPAAAKILRATFPFVSTALTVPVTALLLAALGAVALRRSRRRGPGAPPDPDADGPLSTATWKRPGADVDLDPGVFLAAQILGPIAVLAVPTTPIFGGVKHFLPAMPWLAVVAGIGVHALACAVCDAAAAFPRPRLPSLLGRPALWAALAVLPAVAETRRSHPDGLSHYNLVAGGFAGGASLGMNRQFWGYAVLPLLPWIADHLPPSRNVYWHDVLHDDLVMYERDGRLPPGIHDTGDAEPAIRRSDLGIVIHERHMTLFEGMIWQHYGTARPATVRDREGVPLVTAYRRDR